MSEDAYEVMATGFMITYPLTHDDLANMVYDVVARGGKAERLVVKDRWCLINFVKQAHLVDDLKLHVGGHTLEVEIDPTLNCIALVGEKPPNPTLEDQPHD